jgi:hypothetical protein
VLEAAHHAVYHVLGAPAIASLTATCLRSDRAIDLGVLKRVVEERGDARQRLLLQVADELYGRNGNVTLSELLAVSTARTSTGCSRQSRWSSGGS